MPTLHTLPLLACLYNAIVWTTKYFTSSKLRCLLLYPDKWTIGIKNQCRNLFSELRPQLNFLNLNCSEGPSDFRPLVLLTMNTRYLKLVNGLTFFCWSNKAGVRMMLVRDCWFQDYVWTNLLPQSHWVSRKTHGYIETWFDTIYITKLYSNRFHQKA